MNQPIIKFSGLTKKYGSLVAVDHLNLQIKKGEVFGLLGPNGAGKSTTILMMLGLTEPDAGSVKVCGFDSIRDSIEVKKRTGYLPDEVGFYNNRTGLQNLLYTAQLNGLSRTTAELRALQLLKQVGLENEPDKKTGAYSRGMRQRLGLADVLIKKPEVIILDEPTLGIDPKGVREFLDLIVSLSREEGITVLLSSHHLHQVQQVCDRVGIFVDGRLLAEGNLNSLSASLFTGEPYIIDAEIGSAENNLSESGNGEQLLFRLQETLKLIPGINSLHFAGGMLRLGCSADLTADIAKAVVTSGLRLNYLQKKVYGLDEIYDRYFEGNKAYTPNA